MDRHVRSGFSFAERAVTNRVNIPCLQKIKYQVLWIYYQKSIDYFLIKTNHNRLFWIEIFEKLK